MKPDQDYLKQLLDIFEATPKAYFTIEDVQAAGVDYDTDEFVFHMNILSDMGLIEQQDHDRGYGVYFSLDGMRSWSVLPLRLTAEGHEFANALHNKEVWATLKREFKEASIATLFDVSKQLLKAYAAHQLTKLMTGGGTGS